MHVRYTDLLAHSLKKMDMSFLNPHKPLVPAYVQTQNRHLFYQKSKIVSANIYIEIGSTIKHS